MATIYTGVWWDYATDKLILTLEPQAAGFLGAAIVTWVNIVAVLSWPVIRYLLYSARQRPGPATDGQKDVLHHQKQTAIRNSNSASQAAADILNLMWAYRRKTRAFTRNVLYLAICAAVFLLWTICGLYAPYIYTQSSSDVLLAESSNCFVSLIPAEAVEGDEIFTLFQKRELEMVNSAESYARQCYNHWNNPQCTQYVRQSLPFEKTTGVECPFGQNNDLCATVNSTTIRLDTGYLDTNSDFGINAPADESLRFRRVATCSPLPARGFINTVNVTGTDQEARYPPGEELYEYMFGPTVAANHTFRYTWWQQDYAKNYELTAWEYWPGSPRNTWQPNATLYDAQDADVMIAFLAANQIRYYSPVYDPLFAAGINETTDVHLVPGEDFNEYHSHDLINVLACTEQFQICLPDSDESLCTPLSGSATLPAAAVTLMQENQALNDARIATLTKLGITVAWSGIGIAPIRRASSILLAGKTLNGMWQSSTLPDNQWELEVENWLSIALARMQAEMTSFAEGPDDPAFWSTLEAPLEDLREAACERQRVMSTQGHINFNMGALIVLIVLGAALIVLGLVFEIVVGFVAKYNAWLRKRWEQYVSDGLYQLQRGVLQAQYGVNDWEGTKGFLPTSSQYVVQTGSEVNRESVMYDPKD